ncbi:hypothetical protein EI94DRAFT_1707248 [Lactarius quietus]|nr:hypothetical protein EI94DRAFT_1707248 [Lactarius quietus]
MDGEEEQPADGSGMGGIDGMPVQRKVTNGHRGRAYDLAKNENKVTPSASARMTRAEAHRHERSKDKDRQWLTISQVRQWVSKGTLIHSILRSVRIEGTERREECRGRVGDDGRRGSRSGRLAGNGLSAPVFAVAGIGGLDGKVVELSADLVRVLGAWSTKLQSRQDELLHGLRLEPGNTF